MLTKLLSIVLFLVAVGIAAATPTQVGNASYVTQGTIATAIPFAGLAATGGDVQVAVVAIKNSIVITAPVNFTTIDDTGNSNGSRTMIFVATSSLVSNPTFTCASGSKLAGIAVELSGTSGTIDVHSVLNQVSGATGASTTRTPAYSNDFLLAYYSNAGSSDAVTTAPIGLTELPPTGGVQATPYGVRAYYLLNPPPSPIKASIVWTTASTLENAYIAIEDTNPVTQAIGNCGNGTLPLGNYSVTSCPIGGN
jgi:hypothetical protein